MTKQIITEVNACRRRGQAGGCCYCRVKADIDNIDNIDNDYLGCHHESFKKPKMIKNYREYVLMDNYKHIEIPEWCPLEDFATKEQFFEQFFYELYGKLSKANRKFCREIKSKPDYTDPDGDKQSLSGSVHMGWQLAWRKFHRFIIEMEKKSPKKETMAELAARHGINVKENSDEINFEFAPPFDEDVGLIHSPLKEITFKGIVEQEKRAPCCKVCGRKMIPSNCKCLYCILRECN